MSAIPKRGFRIGQTLSSGTYTYRCQGIVCDTAGTCTIRTKEGGECDMGTLSPGDSIEQYDIIGYSGTAVVKELY